MYFNNYVYYTTQVYNFLTARKLNILFAYAPKIVK